MIINQRIVNGICCFSKVGAYFSLISAGGIVRVKLTLQGSTVLDSAMWVGMSIDQAMPFDEIEIFGDDGPVEFWAGNVSMSQNINSFKGAAAIRTSVVSVLGSAKITGNDLTRQSVRIRTNKEVFLGGAGVSGAGWRLPVGTTEDIPVAGVLHAYRVLPTLDIGQSSFIAQYDDQFPSVGVTNGMWWVSDDGNTRLRWNSGNGSGSLKIWTVESPVWVDHPYFTTQGSSQFGVIHDANTGNLYAIRSLSRNVSGGGGSNADGEMYLHLSTDSGRTFKPIKSIDWGAITDHALVNNSFVTLFTNIVNNVLSISMSGLAIGIDLGSLEVTAYAAGERTDSTGTEQQSRYWIANWCYLDNTFKRALAFDNVSKNLILTEDGGKTFLNFIDDKIEKYKIAPNGNHFIYHQTGTNLGYMVDLADMMPLEIPDFGAGIGLPTNVFNGVWVGVYAGQLTIYYRSGDEIKYERTTDNNTFSYARLECQVKADGTVWRQSSNPSAGFYITDKWKLSIDGEISPAKVEVMELLS